jgi:hypothetical protein
MRSRSRTGALRAELSRGDAALEENEALEERTLFADRLRRVPERRRRSRAEAAFSPEGRRVIYRSHEGSADKIYSVNIDGSDWRTLNDHVGEHVLFAVSPVLH